MTTPHSASNSGMPSTQRPYKRHVRNLLIHLPMQREFTMVLIALLMVSTLAIGLVIHHTIHEVTMGGGFRFGQINAFEVLSEVRYMLILRVTLILLVTLTLLGVFAVFFLHRVAGPVYRFRQIFLRLNDGEIPGPIKLREGDFFSETATEINRLIKMLEFNHNKNKQLRQKLDQLLASSSSDDSKRLTQEVVKILEQSNHE